MRFKHLFCIIGILIISISNSYALGVGDGETTFNDADYLYQYIPYNAITTTCSGGTGTSKSSNWTTKCSTLFVDVYTLVDIKGISVCTDQGGTVGDVSDTYMSHFGDTSKYCWCMTVQPVPSKWVLAYITTSATTCATNCAYYCVNRIQGNATVRSGLLGTYLDERLLNVPHMVY